MAYAGRILIMPKGDYDSTVSYERLDLVRHNGQCWLAKRNVSSVEPSENATDDWFLMLEGINEEGGNAYSLISENGEYSAVMQDDGNMVVYKNSDGSVAFSTNDTAKSADLENYVPYTGTNGVLLKTVTFSNGGRSVYFNAVDDGRFALVDNTNGGLLMEFSKDGKTNTFNGTASGNLPSDAITSGTTELTAGTSALPTGHIYIQYE